MEQEENNTPFDAVGIVDDSSAFTPKVHETGDSDRCVQQSQQQPACDRSNDDGCSPKHLDNDKQYKRQPSSAGEAIDDERPQQQGAVNLGEAPAATAFEVSPSGTTLIRQKARKEHQEIEAADDPAAPAVDVVDVRTALPDQGVSLVPPEQNTAAVKKENGEGQGRGEVGAPSSSAEQGPRDDLRKVCIRGVFYPSTCLHRSAVSATTCPRAAPRISRW